VGVASISCGTYKLYANFLHEYDDDVLNAPIWNHINDAISSSESFETDYSCDGDESESQIVVNEAFWVWLLLSKTLKHGM
jgi:hypothetical protein